MLQSMHAVAATLVAATATLLTHPAAAQDLTGKTIRIVVPWAPGGNVDITARTIAPGLAEALGATVIVENKPGAGGTLGTAQVAKAAPDGLTLTLGSTSTITIGPSVYKEAGYDPLKHLVAIGPIHNSSLVITAALKTPVKSYPEMVAHAKAKNGQLAIGTPGIASTNHLTMELLSRMVGFKYVHIPYKGAGPALNDLAAGQLEMMIDQLPPSTPFIRDGRIRAIAITSLKRLPTLPDVPTLDELGVKGFQAATFTGLFAPAGTPAPVIEMLSAALARTLALPKVQQRFTGLGVEMITMDRTAFAAFVREDFQRWAKIVKDAGITTE